MELKFPGVGNNLRLLLLFVIIKFSLAYSEDNNPYRHRQVLDKQGKYVVEWLADHGEQRIYFNVTVATRGYVGLGLSRNGRMAGADIVMGGVDRHGKSYFSDRHGVGIMQPVVDDQQDWTLHSAWESKSHTFLSFSRPFETCDTKHDVQINDDNVLSLLWAYGETDDESQYHFQNRGSYFVYLLDPDLTPRQLQEQTFANVTRQTPIQRLGKWKVWSIDKDQTIPAQDTAYMCSFHKAPERKKHHVVGIRLVLNSELEARHIHHLVMASCRPPPGVSANNLFSRFVGQPSQQCYVMANPIGDMPTQYCEEFVYEWSVGAGPLFFPSHVGLPIGQFPDEFYAIQVHYDNPQSLPNLRMKFSLELFYTDKLREHDLGLMLVGAQVASQTAPTILIPPSETSHTGYGQCAAGCTQKMLPADGINVFATKLHTHQAGTGVRLMQIPVNGQEQRLGIDDNYNFNYQPHRILREEKIVRPGDMLYTRCIYRTTDRTVNATVAGYSTRDEMCHVWVWLYPKIRKGIYTSCLSQIRSDAYDNFRQIYNTTFSPKLREYVVTSPRHNAGLTTRQVANSIDWTIENRARLQTHHRFLPQVSTCRNYDPAVSTSLHAPQWRGGRRRVTRQLRRADAYSESYFRDSASRGRGRFPSGLVPGYDRKDPVRFSDIQKRVVDPENEFIYLWPSQVTWYSRPSRCPK